MPQSILLLLLLFSISFFLPKSLAQDEVGVDKCACSPGAYEFTLNFTATCDDSNVPNSDNTGILETTCITQATDGGPTLSEVFVEINFFGVIEIEPSNASLAISRRREMFSDMQAVTYTSATSTISDLTADELLRKITVIVFGTNVVGQEIQNVWSVTFTNECGGVPVFDGGQPTPQIGVTKLTSLIAPPDQYCPISSQSPTFAPTLSPTGNPTANPTVSPTSTPTMTPTQTPTSPPTLDDGNGGFTGLLALLIRLLVRLLGL